MAHRVVQADIDLAKQMQDSGSLDTGIIACLCWRGVERAEATRLVDYLRHGRFATAELPIVLDVFGVHQSRARRRRRGIKGARGTTRSLLAEPLMLPSRKPLTWSRLMRAISRWSIGSFACLTVLSCILYVGHIAWLGAEDNLIRFDERNPHFQENWVTRERGLTPKPFDFGEPLLSSSRLHASDLFKVKPSEIPPPIFKSQPFVSPLAAPHFPRLTKTPNDGSSKQ